MTNPCMAGVVVYPPVCSSGGGGGSGTVTSIDATAPIVVTPNPITTVGNVSHAASGVTPATYGDSTHVVQVTVNATGHVTAASNVAIVAGGSGTVTSITATTPIVVTPSPITATGDISHATSGVAAATYGSSTQIPILAVNATGHVTSASNSAAIPSNTGTSTGDSWLWGSGRDGVVHFDGINTFSFATISHGMYVLLRHVHATDCTIDAGVEVGSMDQGWTTGLGGANQIFCTGTLTVNGLLHNNGTFNPAGNNTIGGIGACNLGGISAYYSAGSNGGDSSTTVGSNGTNLTDSYGGGGGAGGANGAGTAGGLGGTVTLPALAQSGGIEMLFTFHMAISGQIQKGSNYGRFFPGAGGGGGRGDGAGHPGGAGGGGGGIFGVFARQIAGSGIISCDGAKGHNAATGTGAAGGGGGGGGGGILLIWTTTLSIPCTTRCLGGTKGNGVGTGSAGIDGTAGIVAKVLVATLN